MTLLDANLLIYAVNTDAPPHARARKTLEAVLSGRKPVGLPWTVLLAFLRLTTRGDVFARPLTPEAACAYVDAWLDLPHVSAVGPGPRHWSILRGLLHAAGTAGNLTSDAHLAALAIELGATLYSADNDFKRFPGLDHVNPLASP